MKPVSRSNILKEMLLSLFARFFPNTGKIPATIHGQPEDQSPFHDHPTSAQEMLTKTHYQPTPRTD